MKSLDNEDVKAELQVRLEMLTLDSQRRWGRMNANQMLCHLSDTFVLLQKDGRPRTPPSILQKLKFSIMRSVALYSGLPFPRGLPTMAAIDQEKKGTPPLGLAEDKETLIKTMEIFSAENRSYEQCFHPILGNLSPKQWQRWGYLHVDHHFKQFGI